MIPRLKPQRRHAEATSRDTDLRNDSVGLFFLEMNVQETKLYKSDENILTGDVNDSPSVFLMCHLSSGAQMEATRSGGGLHVF